MTTSREIQTMRQMEWERVKGGLHAMLSSYWDGPDYRGGGNESNESYEYIKAKDKIEQFINEMDDDVLG